VGLILQLRPNQGATCGMLRAASLSPAKLDGSGATRELREETGLRGAPLIELPVSRQTRTAPSSIPPVRRRGHLPRSTGQPDTT